MINVELTTSEGDPIKSVMGFDEDFILFNQTKDTFLVSICIKIVANILGTRDTIPLASLAQRDDIFVYYGGNLIFYSKDNGSSVVDLLYIRPLMGEEITPTDPEVVAALNLMTTLNKNNIDMAN